MNYGYQVYRVYPSFIVYTEYYFHPFYHEYTQRKGHYYFYLDMKKKSWKTRADEF